MPGTRRRRADWRRASRVRSASEKTRSRRSRASTGPRRSPVGFPAAIRSSVPTLRRVSVTAPPAGETPLAWRGTRTRSAPGKETKTSGGERTSASPSRPTATGSLARISNLVDDHSSTPPNRRCWPTVPRVTSFATAAALGSASRRCRGFRCPDAGACLPPGAAAAGTGCSRRSRAMRWASPWR